ncbi:uncharacterized protein EI97DRAFT_458107 [Westerdykella ornata]|uniref:Uncharacterized protein n=1 Tax=Westerdykella ornata TaxID=318751 RepID=A0A6A6JJF2_WESOR|nr:uncharacterized protein EI97DRAFT_458107 [Westerdykella ornata]KAF2276770.1 hypothetical protein EI97DRAFT_458107 [Westerdykella ornata]
MARGPGLIRRLWFTWKMQRFPWRRKWLAGFDLEGNTFWEFKDPLHHARNRRILKPRRWTHLGDVNIPPQWTQWLRNTRPDPPTLAELQADVARRERLKMLAAQADARWASKPSMLDTPDRQQPVQMLESRDPGSGIAQSSRDKVASSEGEPISIMNSQEEITKHRQVEQTGETAVKKRKVKKQEQGDSPWKQTPRGNPGDDWQPQGWTPGAVRPRR